MRICICVYKSGLFLDKENWVQVFSHHSALAKKRHFERIVKNDAQT